MMPLKNYYYDQLEYYKILQDEHNQRKNADIDFYKLALEYGTRVDQHIANAINYLTPTKGITNKSMTKKELNKRLEATEKKLNDLINDYNKNLDDIIDTLHLFAKTMGYTLDVEDYIYKEYVPGHGFNEKKVIKQRPVLIPIKGKK